MALTHRSHKWLKPSACMSNGINVLRNERTNNDVLRTAAHVASAMGVNSTIQACGHRHGAGIIARTVTMTSTPTRIIWRHRRCDLARQSCSQHVCCSTRAAGMSAQSIKTACAELSCAPAFSRTASLFHAADEEEQRDREAHPADGADGQVHGLHDLMTEEHAVRLQGAI